MDIFAHIAIIIYRTGKFNFNAEIFCPTKRRNHISTINNFPKNINIIYSNLQGMLEGCHFDQFSNEISKVRNVHFIAVTETWLRSGMNTNKSIDIPGFKTIRSDRRTSANDRNKGGGVALYIKQGIKTKVIAKSFDIGNEIEHVEFVFIECLLNDDFFAIAVIYRTNLCNGSNTLKLFELLIELASKDKDVIIIGDFNINILNSISPLLTSGCCKTECN